MKNLISHTTAGPVRCLIKALVAIMVLLCTVQLGAQTGPSREYDIKAAFIYNFTQFVEWPKDAFDNTSSPFVIGILGRDPFGQIIDETVAGEKVGDHPIVVQRYANLQELKKCHVLFVPNGEAENMKEIINELQNKNVLTVSDIPGFPTEGGMIGFMMRDNKTKLQINPSVAKAAEINISSKLLRLADIVGDKR